MGQRRAFPTGAVSIACGLIASLLIIPAGAAQQPFIDSTDAEKEAFLLNAAIVGQEPIGIGITRGIRCTLDDGSVRHDAQIQDRLRTGKANLISPTSTPTTSPPTGSTGSSA